MPTDYDSLFKPADDDGDAAPIDDESGDPRGDGVAPQSDWDADISVGQAGPMPVGPMPVGPASVVAQSAEAPAAPEQSNAGLPPAPPPARPAARSWPGMTTPGGAETTAPDSAPGRLGQMQGDSEATTIVSTEAAAEILNRAAPAPPPTAQYADGRTEIVSVWPGSEATRTGVAPGTATPVGRGDGRTEIVNVWPDSQAMAEDIAPTTAATIGSQRAVDALTHVDVKTSVKMPSQRGWRHILYMLTRINLGLSPDEVYEMDLHTRIRRNARDSYQIGVFGLKGGVGKTAVTVALGSMLSKVRGDRILAVDADPDAGNLADRCGRESAASIADLLADRNLARYNDIRAYTSMNRSNLEVLASDDYSAARRPFGPQEWDATTRIVSRYYNLVLADCGAGLFHPAARSVLNTVSGLVIVASASIDGARQAAITMDWLRQNGYQHLLGRTCVVINHTVPGKPNVDVNDLVKQFESHVSPGRVVVLPYDKHIAAGSAIDLDLLGSQYQRRITELAAALSDDFERLERR